MGIKLCQIKMNFGEFYIIILIKVSLINKYTE